MSDNAINQTRELQAKLWKMANELRGNMDANEFKDYILALIFYRYVSEREESELPGDINNINNKDISMYESFIKTNRQLGFFIQPQYLFNSLVKQINQNTFDLEILSKAFQGFCDSTKGLKSENSLSKLFNDINLYSEKLGSNFLEKSNLISKLILSINEISFSVSNSEIDILGNAYEYLIGKFAASAGKKAGEFYTPRQVSKLLSCIVTKDINGNIGFISDPTCGSGSLLIQCANRLREKNYRYKKIFGQELNTTTCNLARMNMLIHKFGFEDFEIDQGDVLKNPSEVQREEGKMSIIVANPPFSAHWDPNSSMEKDPRFSGAGYLAPKTKADYAFVLHMIHNLAQDGIMAIILPHGPLFRGQAEGQIREYLVKNKNYLDCVIGLPENLFYGTSIAATICVFKKNKENNCIYFIDASKDFEKAKNQNILRDEDIEKILKAYGEKSEIPHYAHLATYEELEQNDFNLNISRYVDTSEEETPIDINATMQEYSQLKKENQKITQELNSYLKELKLPEF